MTNVLELVASLVLDSSEYESSLGGLGEKAGKIGSTVAKAGAAALTAATGATVAFAKSAVDAGAQFDSSMSQVAATMGVSVDEIQNLREFAQDMGATTAFSASQAADALNYMALAGYDADTSMQMLPNVLNLAAAGGMSLASASDMITDTQSALNLSLEETSEMVDQMAKTSSKSNTSVSQLGEAMLTIGATARGVAGGTTELSQVLGVLADNGIKGAEGGTHLRNAILSLQTPTENGAEALASLGMSYDDFYDEAGNMRALPEIFLDMADAMDGLDQRSKDAIVSGLFNKTDLASINALLGTTSDRWEELEVEISGATGAAEEMAGTQLDNLNGDLTLFGSALEGAQIAISDKLTPTLREFVQLGSSALSDMTVAFKEGGLSGAMDALGNSVSQGLSMIIEMLPAAVDAGAQLLGAIIQGIADNIPQLAESAVTITTSFAQLLIDNIPSLVSAAAAMVGELGKGIGGALPELIPAAVEAIASIATYLIDNADGIVEGAVAIITGLGEGLINALPMVIEKVPEIIGSLVMAILAGIPKIAEAGGKLLGSLIANLPEITVSILKGIATLLEDIVQASFAGVASMAWAGGELIMGLAKGMAEAVTKAVEAAKGIASRVVGAVKSFFGIASPSKLMENEVGKMIPQGIVKGMQDEYGSLERTTDEMSAIISPEIQSTAAGGFAAQSDRRIEELLSQILNALSNMGVTLDGKALVGYMGPYMDKELGRIYNNHAREAIRI